MHTTRSIILAILLLGGLLSLRGASPGMPPLVEIQVADSLGAYRFFTGGHLYGAHANARSIYPAASFSANLGRMAAVQPDFFIGLGDLVRDSGSEAQWQAFQQAISQVRSPFFNAPGNHDIIDMGAYTRFLGAENHALRVQGDLFLILNSELLASEHPEQIVNYVEGIISDLEEHPVRNLFVCSHRAVPALAYPALADMDALSNAPFKDLADLTQAKALVEVLAGIPRSGEWWWFWGDLGAAWSVPQVYGRVDELGLQVAGIGLGDAQEDALLEINVDSEGKVKVELWPLLGGSGDSISLEKLTAGHWLSEKGPVSGGASLGERLKGLARQESFWAGALIGIALTVLGALSARRIRKRRFNP